MNAPTAPAVPLDPEAHRELLRAIASLRFGTIEVTVHNSRIVQIERREKIRFQETEPTRTRSP